MVSNEIKSRIAQNCSFYNERSYYPDKIIMQLEQSCNNCSNFVREHCVKDIFDEIYEEIRLN
ncbi:hypothetical protein [Clostridium sp.]|uniref:hypothetical protein n=1 Tax=Clostridium sp. TaxID=1506 RepID=UPI0032178332